MRIPRPLFLAITLLGSACSQATADIPAHPLPRIAVKTLDLKAVEQSPQVPATVQPVEHATLSTRIAARVKRVHVQAGDVVHAGQVLVTLADDDLRGQRTAARSTLSTADAQLQRLQRLVQSGAATRSELEAAQAQRAQAEASVGAADEALRYTELRAPFAGKVQSKNASAGDLVTPGVPVLELEGAGLELVATLSLEDLGALQPGTRLPFIANGGDRGEATLTSIAPAADPVAHRTEVRARIVTPTPGLRGGAFVRLQLPRTSASRAELWVPLSGIVQRGDLRGVFVVEGEVASLRWLLLGDEVAGAVPVRAGLKQNERVIDSPGEMVDGQPVEVLHEH
jgi:membrane fusion protein (multidrug efflux system)